MSQSQLTKAVLLLEDGTVFEGLAAGYKGTAVGEICFNTGMTGYQEVFTDPSYYGQVIVTTNVHIGNYGVKDLEEESSDIQISGLICKNFNTKYSRNLADDDLDAYFERNKIVCIHSVDTREIVRKIRTKGAMNCLICSDGSDMETLKAKLKEFPSMEGLELASKVSTKEPYTLGEPNDDIRISVLDFGTKKNILRCMVERGAYVKVFPAEASISDLLAFNPDGFFLSNGPGDPSSMGYAINTVKEVLKLNKPIFGICLGHQLLALAVDVPTHKMHHGHRGINHPVKNLETGLCEITSQNHGFGIEMSSIENRSDIELTHINLNDQSVEGIKLKDHDAFSVQFHPEAAPGPHDSRYLFDKFINLIKRTKSN